MLRTNLATRPFYNERLAALLIGVVAAIVAGVTIVNLGALIRLSARHAALASEAAAHDRTSVELRRKAQQARAGIDPARLQSVANAALEANLVIERRTFSWTELFNRFEATLPPDVRITAVSPTLGEDRAFVVTVGVVSRDVGEIDTFMDALESRGGFHDVLARQERVDDEGMIEASITGVYRPSTPAAAPAGGQP